MVRCTLRPLYLRGKAGIWIQKSSFFVFPIHGAASICLAMRRRVFLEVFSIKYQFHSVFSSASTYLLCVLLLSNMKHVGPLSPMCKLFCPIEQKHLTTFVWIYKYNFTVIICLLYISHKNTRCSNRNRVATADDV